MQNSVGKSHLLPQDELIGSSYSTCQDDNSPQASVHDLKKEIERLRKRCQELTSENRSLRVEHDSNQKAIKRLGELVLRLEAIKLYK